MRGWVEFYMLFLQRNGILTLVILAVLLVRLLLRRLPKKYSYLLWSVVGIRMLLKLQLPSRFGLLSLWHYMTQQISGSQLLTAPKQLTNMQKITDPQAGAQNLQPAGQLITGQTVTGATQGLSQAGSGLGSGVNQILQICMLIWIAGMIVLLLYGILSYFKCRRMTVQAVHMEGNIWECDHLTTPFVLGIVRPRIYIPFHLSAEEKPYILAHETYHIKRGDPIVRLLAFVLLTFYWINPFVWLAYFLMIRDMEMSCDEAVLLQLGTKIRKAYSNSLLTFATGRKQVTFSPLAFGESDTSGRIKNILDFKKPKVWGSLLAILAVILAAVFCLTSQKTEDDTSIMENITDKIKAAPREDGQNIQDYIQKQGTHTGIIGAITGTVMAVAAFVSELVGTIARNLLWSQQMQDAIANRINRQTPAKSMSVLQKEDGVKENDIQKEETPHVNINNFLKKYDIQGRKFGDSVFLQNGNDNSTITPADCMNPAKLQQAIGTVYGNNLDTSIKAALISAACSLTGEEEKDIHHKIPTKRGTIDIEIKQLEKHFASISINGKNVIEKIPKDILKNPKAFRIVDGKGSLTDHIEQKIEEELSKTHTLSKDLTVSIGKDHTLSVWDKEKEIYKGPAEIKAFENIFTEHPLEEISAKTAAVALYCTLKPEEFAKEYQQKSIFDDFSYPDGTAYISVKQDGISLHEPKLSIIDRDMGKLIQKSSQSCTVKEIMAELGLSKDEAKEVKNLQGDETVVVMSEGVPTFATATDEGEIYLYQPEQMPEILTKRAIEPYLEDHKDLLPVLVEKEGKIQTAYIEENGEISYLPAFSDLGYHMEASDTISLLTPDCITPEYFYEFTQELSSLYQLADEKGQDMPVKVSFAKEPESFTYVKEGSGKQPEKVDPNNLPFPEITKDAQEEKKEEKKENASILEEGIVQVEDRDEEEYDDDLPFSDMPEQTYSDIPPFSDIDDIER